MAKKSKGKGKGKSKLQAVEMIRRTEGDDPVTISRSPYYSPRTSAGVVITPDRAMMNDVVWAARRYLSQSVGQLPAVLKQGKNVFENPHPVDNVLNWRTNPELGPYQWRETLVSWAIMKGNAICEIEFDFAGRVKWLWPIHPERIEILRADGLDGELIYRVWNQDKRNFVDLSGNEVFHLRGYGDGAVGLSVIEFAAQTIGWAKATELFGASFFGNGMHIGGTAVFKQSVKDEDVLERARERLEAAHKGLPNANGWFVGDGDMQITKTGTTPNDAQFVSTMQHQVESICRWMGAPPHKVYHLLRMTFNNVEQMSIDVVGDCIVPWAMRLEDESNYKLFGQNRQNLQVFFDVKGLLRGDFKTRQEGYQIMRRNGIINGDYWAEEEGLKPPGSGNGGDLYIIEGNMTKMEDVGQQLQSPAPSTNPNQTPDPTPAENDNQQAAEVLRRISMMLGEEEGVLAHV